MFSRKQQNISFLPTNDEIFQMGFELVLLLCLLSYQGRNGGGLVAGETRKGYSGSNFLSFNLILVKTSILY